MQGYFNNYKIAVDERMKSLALNFAKEIVITDNQYSRLLPAELRHSPDVSMQQKIEIQRTYMGKLGELAFLKFLRQNNKNVNIDGMLEIYPGQKNVDSFDFITANGKSVDVKTGFRRIHKRLLVNTEQFDNIPKDFYVAVKIDAVDIDSRQKLVDWDNISTAEIMGFAEYDYMRANVEIYNFGEGPARWLYYNQLLGIERLLNMF